MSCHSVGWSENGAELPFLPLIIPFHVLAWNISSGQRLIRRTPLLDFTLALALHITSLHRRFGSAQLWIKLWIKLWIILGFGLGRNK